jgi:hypothetical protein
LLSSKPEIALKRGDSMDEKWVKPTAEELCVNGECTAYSGVDAPRRVAEDASMTIAGPALMGSAQAS